MRRHSVIWVFLCLIVLTGCGSIKENRQNGQENIPEADSMEQEPQLSYEVPVSMPGILVDRLGYLPEENKTVIFKGKDLPQEFYVVDKKTEQIVYQGYPEIRKEEGEEKEAYGDFSDFAAPGTYYIEAPILGKSYSFSISDTVYDSLFQEACKQYYYNRCGMTLGSEYAGDKAHNACHTGKSVLRGNDAVSMDASGGWHQNENGEKNITGASRAMTVLMMSYELYPQEYTDQEGIPESGNQIPDILDEIRYETGWFLKMQDKQTGAVYAGVTAYDKGSYVEPACAGAEFAFAMTMAKFGYLYQNYDKEYAMTCLKAADRAFKHAVLCEEADDREEKIWRFAAAAEIYRAAGQVSYQKYLVEYLSDGDLTLAGDMVQLSGCVTYISTKQAVSMVLCEKIMTMLMDQAEEISEEVRGSLYMTSTEAEGDSSRILTQAAYLTVVNHVISNYEYKQMIENQLHYLLGRNERGIDYISDDTEEAPCVINQFKEDSMLIFMLAGIVSGS